MAGSSIVDSRSPPPLKSSAIAPNTPTAMYITTEMLTDVQMDR